MIKLLKTCAKNTENGKKTKVGYSESMGDILVYQKGGYRDFREVFGDKTINNSDVMRDYFESSYFIICKGDPLYANALAMCKR